MNYLFTGVLVWVCTCQSVYAQVQGIVMDSTSNEPLTYASVAIYRSSDSTMVNGVLTDSSGYFDLNGIALGNYYLKVQFLGFAPASISDIALSSNQPMNVGTIMLNPTQRLLEEVEITGRQTQSYYQIDRQTYRASQFGNARGGTATDVLRNLPSLSVNAQGEISLRGATGFVIMINGKQIQTDPAIILNQLPANAIEDVEVITSPSAKYDPDGKAGIINIVTRQEVLEGFYVITNAQVGLPSIEPYDNAEAARRYNGDITLNYVTGKWDLSVGLDYRRDDIAGRRVGYVNTYREGILTEFPSFGERSFDRENYSGRLGVIYSPDEKQNIGVSFYAGKRTQDRTADILYDYQRRTRIDPEDFLGPEPYWNLYQATGQVLQNGEQTDSLTYFNENLRVRRGDFLIGSLDYNRKLNNGATFSFSALYEHTILGGPTDNINLAWPNTLDTLQLQFNDNDNPLDGVRIQLDYRQKLGEVIWESGYVYRFLRHPGDFIYLDRDLERGTWEVNPLFTNRIELRRQIHAAYTQIEGKWKNLTYTAGIRLAYFDRSVETATPDTTYKLQQVNPFPSLNLQYDLGNDWRARLGYSRRIERTTTFKMTPFPEREHSETLEQGDAELLPEFIHLAELGLVKTWGDQSVAVTGYYRHVKDVINRVNTVFNDSILNRIYTNAGNARTWGMEVGATLYPTQWWQLYLGANVYNYRIQGDLFSDVVDTDNTIYSVNANTTFQLPPTWELQMGIDYLSRRVTAQGVDSRFYNPSLTMRKSFLSNRLAVTLQWLSIDLGLLEANEQRITTVRDNFYTTTNYIYEVDRIVLGVSYQLNQPSKKMNLLKSEFGDKEF